jgi:hypothetical protein
MTIDEYVARFKSLAQFLYNLQNQPDEAWNSKKFEQGLRPEVINLVITQRIREYQTLIQACQLAEHSLATVVASRQLLWKHKREEGISKGGKGKEVDYKGKVTIPKCKTCGKFHKGECYQNKRTCFIFQKPGHLNWQCPNKDQKLAEDDKKKNQVRGRVYTLNVEEVTTPRILSKVWD